MRRRVSVVVRSIELPCREERLRSSLWPMSPKRVRDLLDRIGSLRHPCDLDLLLFFYRHPRTVLSSERLAMYVGYGLSEVAKSLEILIAAELLTRVQRPPRSAGTCLLTSDGPRGEWIAALPRRSAA